VSLRKRKEDWRASKPSSGFWRLFLAELECEFPQEAIQQLALGEQLAARLVWRPPLYAVPWFILSALLATSSAVVWGLTRLFAKPTAIARLPHGNPANVPATSTQEISTEFGAEGLMLRMLGGQLREMIVRSDLDSHLVAAAEWALDRHRARATRLLSLGLGDGDELYEHLDCFVKELSSNGRLADGDGAAASLETLQRLVAVLRAAAPPGTHGFAIRTGSPRTTPEQSRGRSRGIRLPKISISHWQSFPWAKESSTSHVPSHSRRLPRVSLRCSINGTVGCEGRCRYCGSSGFAS
jgi:hypothetical protein